MGLFRQIEVVADNLANGDTVGFKNKTMIFKEFTTKENNKTKLSLSNDISTILNMDDGPIQMTNKLFDLAIHGKGFFRIRTPLGEAYSRAGNFTINQDGFLVTHLGHPVLNSGGDTIVFEGRIIDIKVNKNGDIIVNNTVADQIGIADFVDPKFLTPIGSSLFTIGDATLQDSTGNYEIIQGALEHSNVNRIKELSYSIEVQRAANSTVNLINSIDSTEKSLIKNILKLD
jgi:flagellar basal-body rod protein FlgF